MHFFILKMTLNTGNATLNAIGNGERDFGKEELIITLLLP